jgi:transposase
MGGDERIQDGMFSYVRLEQRVPRDHPLREIRKLTDEVLRSMSGEFDGLYSDMGRRSIAPEYVLRALLLQVLFSVRSERQLVEQIDYNLLFRWFVGLGMDDAMWHHAVYLGAIRCARFGTMRCSRRTATGCSPARWRSGSSPR